MKLCKDCKHYVPPQFATPEKCRIVAVSMVDGSPDRLCSVERKHGKLCGHDGKLFEQNTNKKRMQIEEKMIYAFCAFTMILMFIAAN